MKNVIHEKIYCNQFVYVLEIRKIILRITQGFCIAISLIIQYDILDRIPRWVKTLNKKTQNIFNVYNAIIYVTQYIFDGFLSNS